MTVPFTFSPTKCFCASSSCLVNSCLSSRLVTSWRVWVGVIVIPILVSSCLTIRSSFHVILVMYTLHWLFAYYIVICIFSFSRLLRSFVIISMGLFTFIFVLRVLHVDSGEMFQWWVAYVSLLQHPEFDSLNSCWVSIAYKSFYKEIWPLWAPSLTCTYLTHTIYTWN